MFETIHPKVRRQSFYRLAIPDECKSGQALQATLCSYSQARRHDIYARPSGIQNSRRGRFHRYVRHICLHKDGVSIEDTRSSLANLFRSDKFVVSTRPEASGCAACTRKRELLCASYKIHLPKQKYLIDHLTNAIIIQRKVI